MLQRMAPCTAGYDWGGLASCVVAALWPQRIAGLVSMASYDIINTVEQQEVLSKLHPLCDGSLLPSLHGCLLPMWERDCLLVQNRVRSVLKTGSTML